MCFLKEEGKHRGDWQRSLRCVRAVNVYSENVGYFIPEAVEVTVLVSLLSSRKVMSFEVVTDLEVMVRLTRKVSSEGGGRCPEYLG